MSQSASLKSIVCKSFFYEIFREYILEKPINADLAFVGASVADEAGNLYYKGTTRNFNPIVAMAADNVIVETEEIVKVGTFIPENVHTPAILVDFICKTQ